MPGSPQKSKAQNWWRLNPEGTSEECAAECSVSLATANKARRSIAREVGSALYESKAEAAKRAIEARHKAAEAHDNQVIDITARLKDGEQIKLGRELALSHMLMMFTYAGRTLSELNNSTTLRPSERATLMQSVNYAYRGINVVEETMPGILKMLAAGDVKAAVLEDDMARIRDYAAKKGQGANGTD